MQRQADVQKGYRIMENIKEKIFPIVLIVLDTCASVPYFAAGDFKKGIYWIAAAVLNICVTF